MEDCCRHSLLSHLSSLLLLFQLPFAGSAEEFVVIGPSDPIVAMLGGDVMLPCHLSPAMDMENMELRWFRSKFSEAAFIYQNQQEQREEQLAQYAGRTSLVKDFLTQGEAAMRIHKVQAFDNGLYTCLFRKGNFYEEANLELMVAGVGSAPQVHIQGPEEDGIRVMCMASGWFPKPQVQWRALSGEKFLTFSETYAQDAEGLYSVEAALVVRDSSSGNVTCSVLNAILGQEKVMAIFIPEPFFPQTSPWKPAFMVTLTVLTLLIFGAAYYTKREHTAKQQERQEWEKLHRDKEEDQQTKEKVLKDRGDILVLSSLASCVAFQTGGNLFTCLPGERHSCMQIGGRRCSRPIENADLLWFWERREDTELEMEEGSHSYQFLPVINNRKRTVVAFHIFSFLSHRCVYLYLLSIFFLFSSYPCDFIQVVSGYI
ncbi:butyrophilin subfamily 3 member A2-like isoform X5 [Vulpes vulpes]|uniref:Butyrophilin subfamily 3 member A2-like isoform X5 n=1 Tax=Vulpes vulpes TaxID=9627 RepID=A0ABM4Y299_VULVU